MSDMFFNSFKEYMADGTIDLDSHTFKALLLTDAYTPDATDTVVADLSGEVANGNGYTTGGVVLANVTWNRSGGTVTFDADDPVWTSATFTARYLVIYDDTPTSPADPLLLLKDFGANKSVTGGTFTVEFDASGIFTLS
ncbi:hypothetical protein [Desulforhabdus sp. TSK]|uniref:hypothetical protein n=1 Tax=Desulforhabdus sp. TSK TaxID=2925014 RepID=UPI001FC7F16B|nr:hypothetical protein [Desulforhabdus sp. TSK]GKT09620.1 bacteriophage protein [Desulforhabdus sp. TSK]